MSKKNIIKESSGRYLTEQELVEVIEKILPSLLKKKPELKTKLMALFGDDGVTREEVMAAIEELRKLREDTNKRFEAVDKRFEQMRIDFKEAIENTVKALSARIDSTERLLFSEIENKTKQLSAKMDTIGSRWGILAEGSFRSALNELVKGLGFSVTKWKKRDDGKVFLYPRDVEIDILVKNAKTLAIEVKSSLTLGEVEDFERAVRFYEMNEGKKVDEKIILAIHYYPGVKEYASQMGIKLISEPEELKE